MAYLRVTYSASLHYIVSEDTMAYHSCLNIYCTAMKALKQNPNIQEEFNKTYAERFAVLDFFPNAALMVSGYRPHRLLCAQVWHTVEPWAFAARVDRGVLSPRVRGQGAEEQVPGGGASGIRALPHRSAPPAPMQALWSKGGHFAACET